MSTLTAANSTLALSIQGLYDTPQIIQGYATDDAFATDDVQPVEVQMGVDGLLSGGFVPYPTVLNITLQADSPSLQFFEDWLTFQEADREAYIGDGYIAIPGTGMKYDLTRAFLTSGSKMPGVRKILQPRKFTLTIESCQPAPL
ncbi:phage tail fiber protein [Herbaspirillum chlorophenolicum]|uniref:Phage tail fiber protein n=1 Tax=Herbaspirillum chlorophenolicum TaxID=211589 RepID=A0ABW8F5D8_9BURK